VVFEGLFEFSPDAFTVLFVVFVFAPVFEGVVVEVVFVVVELAVGVEVDFDVAEAVVLAGAVVGPDGVLGLFVRVVVFVEVLRCPFVSHGWLVGLFLLTVGILVTGVLKVIAVVDPNEAIFI
jgi:hypothetical protein